MLIGMIITTYEIKNKIWKEKESWKDNYTNM